jgi:uncharacterized Fe-S cluster-containing radical SAM superfamily protein
VSRFKIRKYYMDLPGDSPWRRLENRLRRRPIPAFPRVIQIQTLTGCNADCIFCPYGATHETQPRGRMSDDLFRRIIAEAAGHDVRRISPYLMNEPLLDRTLCDKIRLINSEVPGCRVVLTTNGHYLTPETAEELLDLGEGLHELHVSLQGIDKKAYDRTMRGNMDFDRTIANVNHFIEAQRRRRAGRPKLWITMVDTAVIDARAAVAYWQSRGVVSKYTVLENLGGTMRDADAISRRPLEPYTTCARLFKQAYIMFNGDMVLCCVDYSREQVLGNISDSGIADVWNGPVAIDIRRRYIAGEFGGLPLCGACRIGSVREISVEPDGRRTVAEPAG